MIVRIIHRVRSLVSRRHVYDLGGGFGLANLRFAMFFVEDAFGG
jgi:hypothetical protein